MSRAPSDLEPRAQATFSQSQRNAILLRQSVTGADQIFRAYCDECGEHIATMNRDGSWEKERPVCFDHSLPRGLYGPTSIANGRAICDRPYTCHLVKSADEVVRMAKADRMAGRSGQAARRAARKAAGKKSLLQGRGFERPHT